MSETKTATSLSSTSSLISSSRSQDLLFVLYDFLKIGFGCSLFRYFFQTELWHFLVSFWTSHQLSDQLLFVVGTVFIHEIIYFGLNGTLYFFQDHPFLKGYRIERNGINEPDLTLVKRTIQQALVSHGIIQVVMLWYLFPLFKLFGMRMEEPLPDFMTIFWHILVCAFLNDFGFYWTHRLLHVPWLYSRIHKKHHEYHGTIGFAAEYAHFVKILFPLSRVF